MQAVCASRSGQRRPLNLRSFSDDTAAFILQRYKKPEHREEIAALIGCRAEELEPGRGGEERLSEWMLGAEDSNRYFQAFLETMDCFDLNEFSAGVDTQPLEQAEALTLRDGRLSCIGLPAVEQAEMDFIRRVLNNGSPEPVIVYSDMETFSQKPSQIRRIGAIALLVRKGIRVKQIFDLNQHMENQTHSRYRIVERNEAAFKNIQIHVHTGKFILISRSKSPNVHFVIRQPNVVNAMEKYSFLRLERES